MGMPEITPSTFSREQAINEIIASVALEQAALAHILNAEGEKLQKIISYDVPTEQLLAVNQSVQSLINSVTTLEVVLKNKLELFSNCLCPPRTSTTTTTTTTTTTSTTTTTTTTTRCHYVSDVDICTTIPNPSIRITKQSKTSFAITKSSQPTVVYFKVDADPDGLAMVLKSAPAGVSLVDGILGINFRETTCGTIVLTVGSCPCAIEVTIAYSIIRD